MESNYTCKEEAMLRLAACVAIDPRVRETLIDGADKNYTLS